MNNKIFSLLIIGLIAFTGGCTVINKTHQQENLRITRLFPSSQSDKNKFNTRILASPLLDLSQDKPRIIVPLEDGIIALQDAESGAIIRKTQIPVTQGRRIQISATPLNIGSNLVVLYRYVEDERLVSYQVAVVDIEKNKLNSAFPVIRLTAEKLTTDGLAIVKFRADKAYSHSAVKHAPKQGSELVLQQGCIDGDIQLRSSQLLGARVQD